MRTRDGFVGPAEVRSGLTFSMRVVSTWWTMMPP
jgi:hypothetical protein